MSLGPSVNAHSNGWGTLTLYPTYYRSEQLSLKGAQALTGPTISESAVLRDFVDLAWNKSFRKLEVPASSIDGKHRGRLLT